MLFRCQNSHFQPLAVFRQFWGQNGVRSAWNLARSISRAILSQKDYRIRNLNFHGVHGLFNPHLKCSQFSEKNSDSDLQFFFDSFNIWNETKKWPPRLFSGSFEPTETFVGLTWLNCAHGEKWRFSRNFAIFKKMLTLIGRFFTIRSTYRTKPKKRPPTTVQWFI